MVLADPHVTIPQSTAKAFLVPRAPFAAGPYLRAPRNSEDPPLRPVVDRLLDAGITVFIDLTPPVVEADSYMLDLITAAADHGVRVVRERLGTCRASESDPEYLTRVLDVIDEHLGADRGVYLCDADDVGHVGLVVGAWLVRHGRAYEDAMEEIEALLQTSAFGENPAPMLQKADERRAVIQHWAEHEPAVSDDATHGTPRKTRGIRRIERYRGALVGLVAIDTLGMMLDGAPPHDATPIGHLMALTERQGDPRLGCVVLSHGAAPRFRTSQGSVLLDDIERYIDSPGWHRGSNAPHELEMAAAEKHVVFDGLMAAYARSSSDHDVANRALATLAPVAMFFARDPDLAIRMAGESARYGTRASVHACRYFGDLLIAALAGVPKDELLLGRHVPISTPWSLVPQHPAVAAVANGSFRRSSPPDPRGDAVIESLEAALWAFANTDDFVSGARAVANTPACAAMAGAVYGQLAGAYYGVDAIPGAWRDRLSATNDVVAIADRLYHAAFPWQ